MRCLLDKVTARLMVQGLLKLSEQRAPTDAELVALDLFARASLPQNSLFIAPPTANVLHHLAQYPHYVTVIQFFLAQVEVIQPARYFKFKGWARRLCEYGFTREDAAMLALSSFGTNAQRTILGTHYLATFDQPMINLWGHQQVLIWHRLQAMQRNIQPPYSRVSLPQVLQPDHII